MKMKKSASMKNNTKTTYSARWVAASIVAAGTLLAAQARGDTVVLFAGGNASQTLAVCQRDQRSNWGHHWRRYIPDE